MNIQSLRIIKEYNGTTHMPAGVYMDTVLSCVVTQKVEQNFMATQVYLNDSLQEVSPVTPDAFVAVRIFDPCTGNVAYVLDELNIVQKQINPKCCQNADGESTGQNGEFTTEFNDEFNR